MEFCGYVFTTKRDRWDPHIQARYVDSEAAIRAAIGGGAKEFWVAALRSKRSTLVALNYRTPTVTYFFTNVRHHYHVVKEAS